MKRICFLLLLVINFITIHAQEVTVNDQNIEEIDVEYIEIVGTSRSLSDKVNVELDFGQNTKFFGGNKQTRVEDKNGKRIKFNSMIDALNFMNNYGFEFVQAYIEPDKNDNILHYLLRKKE